MSGSEALSRLLPRGQTALLIVDVQNDFCHNRGALGKMFGDLADVQASVRRLVPFIAAVKRVGVPVIYVHTLHSDWTNSAAWVGRFGGRDRGAICREGSWGAQFYKVKPLPDDRIVTKHRYSAFVETDLDLILRAREIRSVLLTGVATNVCVESTARHAFMKDYNVILVEDCCGAVTPEEHKGTLLNIERYFGALATSRDVLAALRKA